MVLRVRGFFRPFFFLVAVSSDTVLSLPPSLSPLLLLHPAVHGANGYLVHQFLDSTSNKRTDEWGGSVEKRSKFGLEVIKAVAEVFGADRTAVKVSPAGGYNDMG